MVSVHDTEQIMLLHRRTAASDMVLMREKILLLQARLLLEGNLMLLMVWRYVF